MRASWPRCHFRIRLRLRVFLSGSVGVAFGGDTPDDRPTTYGVSAGAIGGAVGFELDATFTPDFFTSSPLLKDNSVTTVMGNLFIGPRLGPVQPYVVGGIGVMRLHLSAPLGVFEVTRNDLAMNAGGGVML